jgi:hypothetical protein
MVESSFNNNGFHDVNRFFENKTKKVRFLFLGDSYIEGVTVEKDKLLSILFEKLLNDSKNKYEVINFGRVGYSPLLEFNLYRKIGYKYNPNVVILFLSMNSLNMDCAYEKSLKKDNKNNFSWNIKHEKFTLRKWLRERIYIFNYLGIKYKFYNKNVDFKKNNNFEYGNIETDKWAILRNKYTPETINAWNKTMDYIIKLKKLCENNNSSFYVTAIPVAQQVYDKENNGYNITGSVSKYPFDYLKNLCLKNNINYINIFQYYLQILDSDPNQEIFFKNDPHLNENGHYYTAKFLYNYFK